MYPMWIVLKVNLSWTFAGWQAGIEEMTKKLNI